MALVVVPLLVVTAVFVLWGLNGGTQAAFGALLQRLAGILRFASLVSFGLFDWTKWVTNGVHYIEKQISHAVINAEQPLARFLHGLGDVVTTTVDTLWKAEVGTAKAIIRMIDVVIPGMLAQAERNLISAISATAGYLAKTALHDLERLVRGIDRVLRELTNEFGKAKRGIDYINRHALGRVAAKERVLSNEIAAEGRRVGRLTHRVSRLEKELLGIGAAGVILRVLTRHWPWWKCGNVQKGMKALCHFPTQLLDMLLLDALEAAVLLNICEAVKIFTSTAKLFEPELRGIVAVTGAALQCSSLDAPAEITGAWVATPPRQAYAALPGTG